MLQLLPYIAQSPIAMYQTSHKNMEKAISTGEDHRLKKFSIIACVTDKPFSWIWLPTFLLYLLIGCSASSEWDQQWKAIQDLIRAGDLAQAQIQLKTILPSIREKGPSDKRYAQIIYQLGNIARLEGNNNQAESYYWKALPLFAQSLGPEHLRMADPLVGLAVIYQKKDQPKIALPLLKRALAIQEKSWGPSDRKLLPTLKHYHVLLMLSDDHKGAVQILTRISHLEQIHS